MQSRIWPRMLDVEVDRCLACDVNGGLIQPPGGVIHVDDLWQADHELTPLLRGYVILKPRRHVHHLADLTDDEAATLGPVLRRVLGAMRKALDPERIYVASFAETVHHLHFHLIPRYSDMPGLGPDLMPDVFHGRWATSTQAAEDAAALIRGAIGG
jgi:diadenosine tetraphosphate (Ap4A) HIT family hydrolase